jgi:hypothetical protein
MMHHMGLDSAMEYVTTDESEISVNSACCTPQESPCLGRVVRD